MPTFSKFDLSDSENLITFPPIFALSFSKSLKCAFILSAVINKIEPEGWGENFSCFAVDAHPHNMRKSKAGIFLKYFTWNLSYREFTGIDGDNLSG